MNSSEEENVLIDNSRYQPGHLNLTDLASSIPNLSLSGVIQQQNEVVESENKSLNTELLTMSTQTVISFVYCNRQPSLFNLLTQMLTTNTFTPLNPSVEIPFQPSPYPSTVLNSSSSSLSNSSSSSSSSSSPPVSNQSSPILQGGNKSSLMFNILDKAINAVSQQYKKNFYVHILERPSLPSPTSTSTPTPINGNSSINNNSSMEEHDQLVAGCLSFINHMLSAAPSYFDFEKYRQVLSSQGVNEIIKTYVKSVSPCVRLELLHYQKHKINGIKAAKQTSIFLDRQNVLSFINRLCKMSFPNSMTNSAGDIHQAAVNNNNQPQPSSTEEKMKLLGFETDDLHLELQSTGLLGIRNMIYFCARYYRIYNEILQAQIKKHVIKNDSKEDEEEEEEDNAYYSFSRVGFTLTNLIYELYIEDENLYEIIFDQDDWFEELFCISFELFDEIWEREGTCQEDYITVLHKTRAVLSRLKWTNPSSIISFQKTLGNVLDEMWSKTNDIKEEKEMNARVGGLSDSIMGVPHGGNQNGGGAKDTLGNLRFKKFFNEKFKQYRRSTDSVNSDISEASNLSNGVVLKQSQGDIEQPSPVPHKISTKSLSFKKLFTELKTSETERKQSLLSGSNGSLTVVVDDSGSVIENSLSLPSTPRYIGDNEEGSENGSTSSFSFEKLSRKLRSGSASIKDKEKAPKYNISGDLVMNGSVVNDYTSTSSSPSITPSSNVSPYLQSQESSDQSSQNIPPQFNIDDGKKSLKASSSSIYKSVKKAMVNLGEKGKDIGKKVKGSKKSGKKHREHSFEEEQDYGNNNNNNDGRSNVSPYIIPGDLELPTDFRPSLDLDFDRNSDSSYEDSDDDESNTLDDIQSIDSNNMNNGSSHISNSNNNSASSINLMNDIQLQQKPIEPIVEKEVIISTPTLVEQPIIVKPTTPTIAEEQVKSVEPIQDKPSVIVTISDNNNNNNNVNNVGGINRSLSDQSLTDAATLNYHITKNRLSVGDENNNNNKQHSDNSSNEQQTISPSYPRRQMHIVNGGGSHGRNSTYNSQSSSQSKKPVLSRAPIPSPFTNNGPPELVKSPSIKHLVTFFEVRSSELKGDNTSTVSGSVTTLQRQKSFKSDS